jgi:hypothetical protein
LLCVVECRTGCTGYVTISRSLKTPPGSSLPIERNLFRGYAAPGGPTKEGRTCLSRSIQCSPVANCTPTRLARGRGAALQTVRICGQISYIACKTSPVVRRAPAPPQPRQPSGARGLAPGTPGLGPNPRGARVIGRLCGVVGIRSDRPRVAGSARSHRHVAVFGSFRGLSPSPEALFQCSDSAWNRAKQIMRGQAVVFGR